MMDHPILRPEVQLEVLRQAREGLHDALPPGGSGRLTVAVEADYKDGKLAGFRTMISVAKSHVKTLDNGRPSSDTST